MDLKIKRIILFSLVFLYILYSVFVYTAGTETSSHISKQAAVGKNIYQEYNCVACHQIYGLGGYMGPDLTNVISTRGEIYARAIIQTGTERMSNFNLDSSEINALIDYLKFMNLSSEYPLKNRETSWYGTVRKNK